MLMRDAAFARAEATVIMIKLSSRISRNTWLASSCRWMIVAGAILIVLAVTPATANASPEDGTMEDLRERIVRLCNEAWGPEPAREQQCRNDNLQMLDDYIQLVNSYPPTSEHYRVLIECSQRWPESISMWKMCANLEMPNEPAFKPFDTGPSPVDVLRQYQAARPSPLGQPNPNLVPENLRALPNPITPSGGGMGGGPLPQQQTAPLPSVIQPSPASSIQAPAQSNIAPITRQPQPPTGGAVYVPGAGVRQQ